MRNVRPIKSVRHVRPIEGLRNLTPTVYNYT